ncbi:MAG: choice-of-anchor D domain-containing protein [Acidobacteriia bacterium]|nr:choice-of-anchor D domain-containing protein [Terriglobia bacterium]
MGLTWTATGDDGNVGTASYYEVRYSASAISEANWASATRAGNEPTPQVAGSPESMEVHGLDASTFYYFAVKAFDEWGNPGPLSNLASGTTLPPPTGNVDPNSVTADLLTGQQTDRTVVLSNIGTGTLDFTIPSPALGEPFSVPQDPVIYGKDQIDPRQGPPIAQGSGGPDVFGYRWTDSDEPGGPAFSWTDISGTGTAVAGVTSDDSTSAPIALGFNFPFYGTLFSSIEVCSNGWLSFTSSATSYSNQPLPNSGAPENLIAPFWDDLNPGGASLIFFQSFGNRAIIQWNNIPHYGTTEPGTYTFQAIIDQSGEITFQYLTVAGTLNSATIGIQNAAKTTALQIAFNQAYVHDNLAVRIAAIPQWLSAAPTSGRLRGGESKPIVLHMDASGLEGGHYPGTVNIMTNDPAHAVLPVSVVLHVTGAPEANVQPSALAYGDVFVGVATPQNVIVANAGTDTLVVTDITPSGPQISVTPRVFNVAPHSSQNVAVTWTPATPGAFSGSVTIQSNDSSNPSIIVPVTGNGLVAPQMVYDPTSFAQTLFTGQQANLPLTVYNTGGSSLIVNAGADLGNGDVVYASEEGALGHGGPDAFGYRWKDSDESGGPTFDFADISATGTTISFSSSDDALSAAINMGMTFPFYGSNFTQLKVGTNGFLTFDTTDTATRLTNSTLPNTSGAKFMLALLWDDLHLRSGNVKYQFDGARFIVQYTNVEKFSPSGNPMTFQVQIYPNGKILYMYKTMPTGGTYNSLTIGIQDGTKTIGLAADFNANYVHANMAIQFSRTPDWLVVTPSSATIPAGGNFVFNVKFDSTDRLGGVLNGAVVLTNNLPETKRVPAQLTVIGVPIATFAPASYAFGTQYVGYPHLTTFQLVNSGTDVLHVTDVTTNNGTLTVQAPATGQVFSQAAFDLAPGSSRVFNLSWFPTLPGALPANAAVQVHSDDPVNPIKSMPVSGTAILVPVAVWSPPSFSESLLAGDSVHRTLHLENQGGSDLTYSTDVHLTTGAVVQAYPPLDLKKEEPDPRPGILGSGGPDTFGYRWRDSDALNGPTFSWQDISGIGTPVNFTSGTRDDGNAPGIPLGFSFPFYGGAFTTVNICTNGWLSFTNSSTSLSNSPLPGTGSPENMLAVFWDDLDLRTSGNAYYYSDGSRFIVSYVAAPHYSSGGPYTFEVILYPNGRIVFQYLDMQGTLLDSATIGIQNATMDDGLTVDYNANYVHNGLAVEFQPPAGWLSVGPRTGTIPAGGFMDLDVAIDSSTLIGGDYAATVDITTNDPAHGVISVPVGLHVTGIPLVGAIPASLTFPMTYVGYHSTLPLTIKNVGTDILHLNSYSVSGDFSLSGLSTPVDIPVFGSIPVTVEFSPTTAGSLGGSISIVSNDATHNPFVIPLAGTALIAPVIEVAPASIDAVLPPNSTTTRPLTVCNTGGSDLVWQSGTNIISGGSAASYGTMDLGKDEPDPRVGILGSGGPDLFGYRWTDSDEPGGPVFNWADITGVGTPVGLNSDDQSVTGIPIGFPFKFYGNTFSTVAANSNGWLSFTSTVSSGLYSYDNQPLPTGGTSYPENLLAPFWDDMNFSSSAGSAQAFYYNDGLRFIVEYVNVPHYTGAGLTGLYTYETILYPDGKIVYQYLSMTGTLDSATIGIQNAARNDGLTVVFNSAYVHDNLAVQIASIPEWARLTPVNGTVPAGQCQDVTVSMDSTGLGHGPHDATFDFTSNDPANAHRTVTVHLAVDQKPTAVAGAPQQGECTGNLSATFTLSGSGSDPDGDPLTFLWSAPGITFDDPTSPTPTASFPLGSTVVTLVVNDGFENSDPATVTITVVDTEPPVISAISSPSVLWPPNHRMVTVNNAVIATDVCDPNPSIILTAATSNEPDDAQGGGDGTTTNDIQGAAIGTPDFQILLRAERDGQGSGRAYTMTYRASDVSGNASSTSTQVSVPHDMRDMAVEPLSLLLQDRNNTKVIWGPVEGAQSYDVVRGDLANLRVSGSNIDLGQVVCIDHATTATTTAGFEDTAVPAPGHVFFYAVQYFDGIQSSSYGSESTAKARVVLPGNGDCQ